MVNKPSGLMWRGDEERLPSIYDYCASGPGCCSAGTGPWHSDPWTSSAKAPGDSHLISGAPTPPHQSSTLGLEETRRDTDAGSGRLLTVSSFATDLGAKRKASQWRGRESEEGWSWGYSTAHEVEAVVTKTIRRPHVGLGVAETAPSQVGTCSSGNWQRRLFQSLW